MNTGRQTYLKKHLRQVLSYFFEMAQIGAGRGRWVLLGLIAASTAGGVARAAAQGMELTGALGWIGGVNLLLGVVAGGLWGAMWAEQKQKGDKIGAFVVLMFVATTTALVMLIALVARGYFIASIIGVSGVGVGLTLLAHPQKLARGPLSKFLWQHAGVGLAGEVATNLPPEMFARLLKQELQEETSRPGLLRESRQERIVQAVEAMNKRQVQSLSHTTWQKLLGHSATEVRQAALRASRHRNEDPGMGHRK